MTDGLVWTYQEPGSYELISDVQNPLLGVN